MTEPGQSQPRLLELARMLGAAFAERAAANDVNGHFDAQNYAELKHHKLFSAAVPAQLGGGGATHAELCEMLRELAHFCPSTALALSMHTHLVAAAVWRFGRGQPAEALLRKVAASELVLVSTGAGDWVDSHGRAERVEGGYRVTAVKRFASGCLAGDLLITTVPFEDSERGSEVLHFALPLRAQGVTIRQDWDTLGMRASGSHSVELAGVFVPDETISLRRPRGWHPSWNVVLTVAAPIYTAPYVGIAERAATLAREAAARRPLDANLLQTLGELENALATAQLALREMIAITRGYDFEPSDQRTSRMLVHKTLCANAAKATLNKAMELAGGGAFFRAAGIERLFRDVQAASFHPLPEKRQLDFTARVSLGLSPIAPPA